MSATKKYRLERWNGMGYETMASYNQLAIPSRRWAEYAADGVICQIASTGSTGNKCVYAGGMPAQIFHWGGDIPRGYKILTSIINQNHILQWDVVIPSSDLRLSLQQAIAKLGCITERNRIVHLPESSKRIKGLAPSDFSQQLRDFRQAAGLLQKDIARDLGITRAHYARLERAESPPSFGLAVKAAEYIEQYNGGIK